MSSPARLVALAPNWLGDAVMALPALDGIRAAHPSAKLIVAARPAVAPLYEMVAGVDEIIRLGGRGGWRGVSSWTADVDGLKTAQADTAILFPNSFRAAWIVSKAGIPERWGFVADLRRRWLTRAVPRLRGRRHMTEYYAALVSGLGMAASTRPAAVQVSDSADGRAGDLLRLEGVADGTVLVGMAPGAAYGKAKQWPPERFAQLAVMLKQQLGVVSVIVGAKGDIETGRAIAREVTRIVPGSKGAGAVTTDLVGKTDLAALAGVMRRCRAFVANDSGAMHLAAAVGTPVTAIFGSTDEVNTAPMPSPFEGTPAHEILATRVWCRPCMLRECPIDHRCMTGIDVARVADAVARQVTARQP